MDLKRLRSQSLFSGLSEAEFQTVAGSFSETLFEPGQNLITEGEMTKGLYLIFEGTVAIRKRRRPSGAEREIAQLPPGHSVGEMEILDIQPAVATVQALTEVKAAFLPSRALFALQDRSLQTFTLLILNLSREVTRRLRAMDESSGLQPPSA